MDNNRIDKVINGFKQQLRENGATMRDLRYSRDVLKDDSKKTGPNQFIDDDDNSPDGVTNIEYADIHKEQIINALENAEYHLGELKKNNSI